MDYNQKHINHCLKVLDRAERYAKKHGIGPTYLCRLADAPTNAFKTLRSGKATASTVSKIENYLDRKAKKQEQGAPEPLTDKQAAE